jgi:hypothetical protein
MKHNTTMTTKNEVIDYLESKDENDSVELAFIGEAWINGNAKKVDNGKCTFSVPVSHMKANEEWAIESTCTSYHVSDILHTHDNAPEWVQNWYGPFTIKLENLE